MEIIRVFIIENDLKILRDRVKLLNSFLDIDIVGTALTGEEALLKIKKRGIGPDVILCDLDLPRMNAIDTTKIIKAYNPNIEVLILSVFLDENMMIKAIIAGASGCLQKDAGAKIHEAILEVFHGGCIIEPTITRRLLKHFCLSINTSVNLLEGNSDGKNQFHKPLTLRELECLQIIAKGLSNHEAASVLKLSTATVRTHLEHIYQKLDVTNRVEAITEGIRQGIIDL